MNYRFAAVHSGKVADVFDGSTAAGAQRIQWTAYGGLNQECGFVPSNESRCRIGARQSGLVLDVWEASTADGARLSPWTYAGNANQRLQPQRG